LTIIGIFRKILAADNQTLELHKLLLNQLHKAFFYKALTFLPKQLLKDNFFSIEMYQQRYHVKAMKRDD